MNMKSILFVVARKLHFMSVYGYNQTDKLALPQTAQWKVIQWWPPSCDTILLSGKTVGSLRSDSLLSCGEAYNARNDSSNSNFERNLCLVQNFLLFYKLYHTSFQSIEQLGKKKSIKISNEELDVYWTDDHVSSSHEDHEGSIKKREHLTISQYVEHIYFRLVDASMNKELSSLAVISCISFEVKTRLCSQIITTTI